MNKKLPEDHVSEVEVLEALKPKYHKYMTLHSRSASFEHWPQCLSQQVEALSNAGFFYTGKADRVICFTCGGGVKDWTPISNPWTEHAVLFPQCSFVALNNKHLNKINHSAVTEQKDKPSQPSDVGEGNNAALSDMTRMCHVCCNRELGAVFLPCGHMITCDQCCRDLKTCPMCQSHVNNVIRAFLP